MYYDNPNTINPDDLYDINAILSLSIYLKISDNASPRKITPKLTPILHFLRNIFVYWVIIRAPQMHILHISYCISKSPLKRRKIF